jgi:hypothetical protein
MAHSTPSWRKRSMRDSLDRPLAMSRGSGATLASRTTLRIHNPRKNKTLEAYPILPRPRGLHPPGALAHTPPEKRHPKTSRVPGNKKTQHGPTRLITNVQSLKEYTYSSIGLRATPGGCACAHPLEKSNPKTRQGPNNNLTKAPQRA